jgi:hypothetical protein
MTSFVFAAVNGDGDLDTLLTDPIQSLVDPTTDRVDITEADPEKLNAYAAKIHAVFPTLKVTGHVPSLDDVRTLVAGSLSGIYGIDYDFEKGMTPEFSKDPAAILQAFTTFADIVHAVPGLVAIGYITGTELGDDYDYGPVAKVVDRLTIQTQEAAAKGLGDWTKHVDEYNRQLAAAGVAVSLLGLQFTFDGDNDPAHQVDPSVAIEEYQYSQPLGDDEYELWDLSAPDDIVTFLQGVGR